MKEVEITRGILKTLKAMNIFAWKVWQGPFSKPGISDILGCLPDGRMLAVEVKNSNGKITEHQQRFLDEVNQAGGLGFIAKSVEDVIRELGAVGIESNQRSLFDERG